MLVSFIAILQSCSNGDKSELPLFNFGEGNYKQPFRGILKCEPEILVRSMRIIPFKWFAPDTTFLEKSISFQFNEESLRSKSIATISFTDSLGRQIEGLSFYYNGSPVRGNKIMVKADSLEKKMNLRIIIDPDFGNKEIIGFVYVSGIELDEVNDIPLHQENNIIAKWRCAQTFGYPILLWLIWLITTILAISLVIVIIYFLYKGIIIVFVAIGQIFQSQGPMVIDSPINLNNITSKTKSNKENKTQPKEKNDEKRTDQYGYWVNENLFRLYPNYVIPNGNQHKNPKGKTNRQLAKDLGDSRPEIKFKNGYPVFDKDGGTKDNKPLYVVMKDGIHIYLKKEQLLGNGKKDRMKLHLAVYKEMANKYGMEPEELQVFKGNSAPIEKLMKKWNCSENTVWKKCKNPHRIMRVLHECEDCKTVQLVPWLYHHVSHTGGIEKVTQSFLSE